MGVWANGFPFADLRLPQKQPTEYHGTWLTGNNVGRVYDALAEPALGEGLPRHDGPI